MPDFAVAHFNRANVLHELGRFDEALAGYDRALALAPKTAESHLGARLCAQRLGPARGGAGRADTAAELKPELAAAATRPRRLLAALGRAEEARAAREKAAELEAEARQESRGRAVKAAATPAFSASQDRQ